MVKLFTKKAFGSVQISVNDIALTKTGKNSFTFPDGKTAYLKGNYISGVHLWAAGQHILISPKPSWYEIVLGILPFILVLIWGNNITLCSILPIVGGAIGGGISGLFSMLSIYSMKYFKNVFIKIGIGILFVGISFVTCLIIGTFINSLFLYLKK